VRLIEGDIQFFDFGDPVKHPRITASSIPHAATMWPSKWSELFVQEHGKIIALHERQHVRENDRACNHHR
jgi:beta-lactamase regulating signal transducer with metallopeptidase domain